MTTWTPPFRFEVTSVFDSKGHKVCDIRGWGFLTGKGSGGLGLDPDKATEIQDQMGERIAELLNSESTAHSRGMSMAAEIETALREMLALWDRVHGTAIIGRPTVNAAKKALAAIPSADRETERCEWRYDDNEHAPKWDSSCGEAWSFIEGGPDDNRVKYCHGCGKPISIKEG